MMRHLLYSLRNECYKASSTYHDSVGNCLTSLFREDGTGAEAWLARSRQSAQEYDSALANLLNHLLSVPDCEQIRAEMSRTRRLLELLDKETHLMSRWIAILSRRDNDRHRYQGNGKPAIQKETCSANRPQAPASELSNDNNPAFAGS